MNGRRMMFANAADRKTSHKFSQKSTCLELSAGKKNADDRNVISTAEYLRGDATANATKQPAETGTSEHMHNRQAKHESQLRKP